MSDEIDLGDGLTAEFIDDEIVLADKMSRMEITLTFANFDRLAHAVDIARGEK